MAEGERNMCAVFHACGQCVLLGFVSCVSGSACVCVCKCGRVCACVSVAMCVCVCITSCLTLGQSPPCVNQMRCNQTAHTTLYT